MRKAGATRTQAAAVAFVIAIIAFGISYTLTSLSETVTRTTTETTARTEFMTETTTQTTAQQILLPSTSTSSSASSTGPLPISHVIIILMENEGYGDVIGNTSAPYENQLASEYAISDDYYAITHPSLPNYMALVAGDDFNVSSDCFPSQCSVPSNITTIASLLDSHGLSWKEYAESMPVNCSQINSADGLYVTKHDPFVYFDSITGDNGTGTPSTYCDSHVVSFDQFWTDLQAGDLPSYSFITPNICDDAHSCPLLTGDHWLSTVVPRIINSTSFSSTALFITYDEGTTDSSAAGGLGGGKVLCILVSPFAKHGYDSDATYSHYSLLATVEEIFNLGSMGRNDADATPLSDLFTNGIL